MGAFQQLLALPVACMLFALARAGGAKVAIDLLRSVVATIALHDATSARCAIGVPVASTAIARVVVRGAVSPAGARARTKVFHALWRSGLTRVNGVVAPIPPFRRNRTRRAMAVAGSIS